MSGAEPEPGQLVTRVFPRKHHQGEAGGSYRDPSGDFLENTCKNGAQRAESQRNHDQRCGSAALCGGSVISGNKVTDLLPSLLRNPLRHLLDLVLKLRVYVHLANQDR